MAQRETRGRKMPVTTEMGLLRIVHKDANDNTIAELMEKHTSEFGSAAGDAAMANNDPQKMPKVKKGLSTVLKQDDKLVLMFNSDGAQTGAASDLLTLRIPVTFRNVRTGVVYEKTLVAGDFDGDGDMSAQNLVAGTWTELDYYVVPAQSELKLGHAIQDVRVDSALNFWYSDAA